MLSEPIKRKINTRLEELTKLKPIDRRSQIALDKKFRLEFNFNSNHLEGNTLTYSETELLLIFDQTDGTHDYRELIEMEAHDVALKMIEREAADHQRPLLESFIRTLNQTILVKPFWKDAQTSSGEPTKKEIIPGKYKTTPNSVRLNNGEMFQYTSPNDVDIEMNELIQWLNENNDNLSPIELAASLHYRFVRIHPFDDGNGRTARLLMNYVLLKNDYPIVIIKSKDKKDYLAALNKADSGDISAFINYIGNQSLWSFDISIKAAKGESIEEDDDLDKELELLVKDLQQIPDEYDKRKTISETSDVLLKSVYPIYMELDSKLAQIYPLFVGHQFEVDTIELEAEPFDESTFQEKYYSISKDKVEEYITGEYKNTLMVNGITISLKLSMLKKVIEEININETIYFTLDDFHYKVSTEHLGEIYKLPYGRFLSKDQISQIVKKTMYSIINEIKRLTNIER